MRFGLKRALRCHQLKRHNSSSERRIEAKRDIATRLILTERAAFQPEPETRPHAKADAGDARNIPGRPCRRARRLRRISAARRRAMSRSRTSARFRFLAPCCWDRVAKCAGPRPRCLRTACLEGPLTELIAGESRLGRHPRRRKWSVCNRRRSTGSRHYNSGRSCRRHGAKSRVRTVPCPTPCPRPLRHWRSCCRSPRSQ